MTEDKSVSEERAHQIWHRAAELQAEAARKLEERSRALAPSDAEASDFRLADVKAAAVDAGISPEFVDLALAEAAVDGGALDRHEGADRRGRRFLGTRHDSVEVSRVIRAPGRQVLDSLQRILPSARYALLHVDTLGEDPLSDGVFVFEPPSVWAQSGPAGIFAQRMSGVGAKRLYVSLRAIDESRTEVAIRVPVARGTRINYRVGVGVVTGTGIGGGVGGAAAAGAIIGGALVAPLAIPIMAVGALVGAGGIGSLTWWGIRAGFRHGLKKAEEALATLIQAVDASSRTGSGFALPELPPTTSPMG